MLASDLVAMFGHDKTKEILQIVQTMNPLLALYEFNTLRRLRYFWAQVGHESGGLKYTAEIASGKAYEGRKDLGNVKAGDGVRYKGRGYLQITGRKNYTLLQAETGIKCVEHPELLEQPKYAILSALWYWKKNNLNAYADRDAFTELTKKINGGTNGLADRMAWLKKANKCITEV
jgi:putative chitinase